MLEVGALTTITPLWVAALTSTLSRPTPARATTFSRRRRGERLGVDLGGAAHQDGVGVGDRRQQLGTVGAVAVPDLEVGSERVDGGGAQLFGDEYDGLAHVVVLEFGCRSCVSAPLDRPHELCLDPTVPDRLEGDAVHAAVPDRRLCRDRVSASVRLPLPAVYLEQREHVAATADPRSCRRLRSAARPAAGSPGGPAAAGGCGSTGRVHRRATPGSASSCSTRPGGRRRPRRSPGPGRPSPGRRPRGRRAGTARCRRRAAQLQTRLGQTVAAGHPPKALRQVAAAAPRCGPRCRLGRRERCRGVARANGRRRLPGALQPVAQPASRPARRARHARPIGVRQPNVCMASRDVARQDARLPRPVHRASGSAPGSRQSWLSGSVSRRP